MDAKEAFYAVLRTLVAPIHESDEAVAYLFKHLGLPQEAMQELRRVLQEAPMFTTIGLPQATITDVASTYTGTHFTMRGSAELGIALRGSRPGHPYADIVFAFAFQKVLQILVEKLDAHDLRPRIPRAAIDDHTTIDGDTRMPPPAFFDDFVVPVLAPNPFALHQKLSAVLHITGTAFAKRSMTVNDKPGKTEIMCTYSKKGHKQKSTR